MHYSLVDLFCFQSKFLSSKQCLPFESKEKYFFWKVLQDFFFLPMLKVACQIKTRVKSRHGHRTSCRRNPLSFPRFISGDFHRGVCFPEKTVINLIDTWAVLCLGRAERSFFFLHLLVAVIFYLGSQPNTPPATGTGCCLQGSPLLYFNVFVADHSRG